MSRTVLIATLGLASLAGPANAERGQNGAWCLRDDKAGTVICAYASLRQCLASKASNTDDCMRNPRSSRARAL
jgi:hypothetical protein